MMDPSEFAVAKALDATREGEGMTDRERQLIGMAVTATRGCQVCTGSRIERALQSDIPYEAIRATIDLAAGP